MSKLRILLVDDDTAALEALSKLLRCEGHEVHSAVSVRDAVGLAESCPCDLLITDIGLPDGTAMDLMGQLRRRCSPRGIVVSGHAEEEYRAQSRTAGFDKHFVKPIHFKELLAAIAELSVDRQT